MDDAVVRFFPDSGNWDLHKFRSRQAESIQIIAHGPRLETSLLIYDDGEGQHPRHFEDTFLSLLRGNKNEIHFVQGKYNMGGRGRDRLLRPAALPTYRLATMGRFRRFRFHSASSASPDGARKDHKAEYLVRVFRS